MVDTTPKPTSHARAPLIPEIETEVLIVGAGPAGATAALALATYGIETICLNKHRSTSPTPRAHITNQRSMEILRDFGVEREAIAMATPHALMSNWVFCDSLAGPELARLEGCHTHPRYQALHDLASPTAICDLPQHRLEPILVKEAMIRGAHLRFDSELLGFEQRADGVTAEVLDRLTKARYRVKARYLIGADGASSRVAEQLALPLEGRKRLGGQISVLFKADLSKYVAHRPGLMFFVVRRGAAHPGVLRMVQPWDRWVASSGFDVEHEIPDLSEANARRIAHGLIGDDSVPLQIETAVAWTVNHMYAKEVARGRVFCVGDAIHRHPPMNALGSNTSMQDAYNLAWKLAYVLRGQAGPALLSTYREERQPVAKEVVDRAFNNMKTVFGAIGEALPATADHERRDEPETHALGGATSSDAERRALFRKAVEATTYGFSAIGGEINQLYDSAAIIKDARALSVADAQLDLILGLEAGRRLPHAWLTHEQRRVSTLDLCGKGRFTLLTGLAGGSWREAAADVSRALGVPLDVHVIGPGQAYEDPYGDFSRMCLEPERQAVLVRPDQVVAWRGVATSGRASADLRAVLAQVLSLSPSTPSARERTK